MDIRSINNIINSTVATTRAETEKKAEIKWLSSPIKSIFHADPFGFEIDGKKMIIFEDYSKKLTTKL